MAASAARFKIFQQPRRSYRTAPVSSIMAANESRQSPIRIKRSAVLCFRPGGFAAPEERWCRFASNGLCTDSWLSHSDANPLLARVAGDPFCCPGDGERHPIQTHGLCSRPHFRACRCRRNSCETAPRIKGLLLLQHVVTGSSQFMS